MPTPASYSLGKIVFSHQQINNAIIKYAEHLNREYANKKLVIIGILNGAVFFVVQLIRYLKIEVELDFIAISSYQSQVKKEKIKFYKDIKLDLRNKDVLVLEDIIDSGATCRLIEKFFRTQTPQRLRFCSLISLKPSSHLPSHYTFLFQTAPRWLVGFGLDIDERFRHLPDIHELVVSNSAN